ncbi:MAG: hypothetical protein IPL61_24340 [Myxococcales bacterium]|nr:hypothetical protein [Myxococcales bacterium]
MDTPQRRTELLVRHGALDQELERLAVGPYSTEKKRRMTEIHRETAALRDEYLAGLPQLALSRCPSCTDLAIDRFDDAGIDGLWWRYDRNVRRYEAPRRCRHYFCFTGALTTVAPVESTYYTVEPGPDVPFVVPQILEGEGMRAVLWSLPVGRHTGYPIFYYGDPIIAETYGLNDWGDASWGSYTDGNPAGWASRFLLDEECDFDLAPWIARGKLLYILPGDATMTLRSDVAGCPYLDLPGRRYSVAIRNGQVRP